MIATDHFTLKKKKKIDSSRESIKTTFRLGNDMREFFSAKIKTFLREKSY